MLIRCSLTQISACIRALDCDGVREKLYREQPRVLCDLQRVLSECRNLNDLRSSLTCSTMRTGLCYNLSIDDRSWADLLQMNVRQFMLQFKSDMLSDEYLKVQRVHKWVLAQGDAWRFSWEEVKKCRNAFEREDGAPLKLRALWQAFNQLGYTRCCENWQSVRAEMLRDDKRK